MTPGLRRARVRDGGPVGSDPVLVKTIHAEIEREGPLTFARFMELALYAPEHGYYRAFDARAGRLGDFLTAPEAHPIFGRALARLVADAWRALGSPARFAIREYGAGGGALGEALLRGIEDEMPDLAAIVRYRPLEVEPRRLDGIRARLAGARLEPYLEVDDRAPIVGAVLANEVLDALPTHRLEQRGGRLYEVLVGFRDNAFVDVLAQPSTPALAARLADEGVELANGQRAEVCLALDDWLATAAVGLERGLLLLIDYGHPAAELYDPVRRATGTLAAYLGHRVHGDPYQAVGRQDLTAHVDVTAIERAARAAGLDHLGTTTQGRFLAALGAGDLLVAEQTRPGATLESYLEARSALVRMIDPAAMGGFRVLAFGRGLAEDPPLRGIQPEALA